MSKMVNDIRGSFEISDLGEPTRLLGMKIHRNRDLGTIHLSKYESPSIGSLGHTDQLPTYHALTRLAKSCVRLVWFGILHLILFLFCSLLFGPHMAIHIHHPYALLF